jgi:hypothetical protein
MIKAALRYIKYSSVIFLIILTLVSAYIPSTTFIYHASTVTFSGQYTKILPITERESNSTFIICLTNNDSDDDKCIVSLVPKVVTIPIFSYFYVIDNYVLPQYTIFQIWHDADIPPPV